MEVCEHCGGPIEVDNCAYKGCRIGWNLYMDDLLEAERTMERQEVAKIIATYLNDRDDFASAEVVGDQGQIAVQTQGGAWFTVEVGPVPAGA